MSHYVQLLREYKTRTIHTSSDHFESARLRIVQQLLRCHDDSPVTMTSAIFPLNSLIRIHTESPNDHNLLLSHIMDETNELDQGLQQLRNYCTTGDAVRISLGEFDRDCLKYMKPNTTISYLQVCVRHFRGEILDTSNKAKVVV